MRTYHITSLTELWDEPAYFRFLSRDFETVRVRYEAQPDAVIIVQQGDARTVPAFHVRIRAERPGKTTI